MQPDKDMLALSAHLPEVQLPPGVVLLREGDPAGPLWVLVSGALTVSKGGVEVNTITQPGAVIGEISLLLQTACGATVQTAVPSVVRQALDGRALMDSDPGIAHLLAVGLAERLNAVTGYLADLKLQYADAPGLSMVSEVLAQLSQRKPAAVRPGSAREPDPEY